jgi:cytosine/adenosine deaminase-related metal-dependent hydrolase
MSMWGSRATTLVNGTVLGPDGRLFDSVRIRRGVIDALGASPSRRDTVIDVEQSVVLPGLINAHDHLELNSFPRLKWREHYANVSEWIADFQPRFGRDPQLAAARPETIADRVWVGALKNLLSGVTTVCHHNPLHRALRRGCPVKVVRKFGLSHSLQIDGARVRSAYSATPATWPWIIHAAEGVDAAARDEIQTLADMGCLASNTVLVHGVALDSPTSEYALDRGASLVWCPTSNHFLFGRTADVRPFADHRRLAIGSDSRLSGAGDLLDEMRGAFATRQVSAESLVRAATVDGARVLRLPDAGRLTVGASADLTVLQRLSADPFETAVSAARVDVRLTMVDGRPLVADPAWAAIFPSRRATTPVRVDGVLRLLAEPIARRTRGLTLQEPGLELAS